MEFSVRTNKLKQASSEIKGTGRQLRRDGNTIERVSRALSGYDGSYDAIKARLRETKNNLEITCKGAESMAGSMEKIASLYEKAEKNIYEEGRRLRGSKDDDLSRRKGETIPQYFRRLAEKLGVEFDNFDAVPDWVEVIGWLNRQAPWTWVLYKATREGWLDPLFDALDFEKSKTDGCYHVNTDKYDVDFVNKMLNGRMQDKDGKGAWQQYGGYTDAYDYVFDAFCDMEANKDLVFTTASGTTYTLWRWKGEYLNLGGGGEIGIYKGTGEIKECAVNDKLKIKMHVDYGDGTSTDWSDETWWCTSFNPEKQDVRASDIKITYTIDFKDADPEIWAAFQAQQGNNPDVTLDPDSSKKIAYITF